MTIHRFRPRAAEARLFATSGYVEVAAAATADAMVAFLETDQPETPLE
ncbi:MAG: hypothetical protein OXC98_01555 [bacterium]|nr:hypothetical protein [Acidimicrobiia bacterium]MCY4649042.1 hypothetical protein [bacterium]